MAVTFEFVAQEYDRQENHIEAQCPATLADDRLFACATPMTASETIGPSRDTGDRSAPATEGFCATRSPIALLDPLARRTEERKKSINVLFVCLGNICRSPAAEAIFRDIVEKAGEGDRFFADSAGLYHGHAGSLPDARMRIHAARRGYNLTHKARPVTWRDFAAFDIILAMDDANYEDLRDMAPDPASARKVQRMVEFCRTFMNDSVPDPYYSGADGFELVLDLLEDACRGLYESLSNKH